MIAQRNGMAMYNNKGNSMEVLEQLHCKCLEYNVIIMHQCAGMCMCACMYDTMRYRPISQTEFMLSITINRAEHDCVRYCNYQT